MKSQPRWWQQWWLLLNHQKQKSRLLIQVLTILWSHAARNSIFKMLMSSSSEEASVAFSKCFFLFTETEIIEEFTEPIAVETTEVGLIFPVSVNVFGLIIYLALCWWFFCFFLAVRKQTVHPRRHLQQQWERAGGWVEHGNRGMLWGWCFSWIEVCFWPLLFWWLFA